MTLSNEIKNFIKDHSRESLPNECGGLILKDGAGNLTACRCRNASDTPKESCVLRRDEVKEKSNGYIVEAIYHSHSSNFEDFSWEDKYTSEEFKLKLVLFCSQKNTFNTYGPNGFIAPFTGRRWSQGVFSCITIIEDYYKKTFGIEIKGYDQLELCGEKLKYYNFSLALSKCHLDEKTIEMLAAIALIPDDQRPWQSLLIKNNFVKVKDFRKHDIILTKSFNENFNKKFNIVYPIHAAIYLGDGRILHHPFGEESAIEAFGEKEKLAITHIFRHKNFLNEN